MELLAQLRAQIGARDVIDGTDVDERYLADWSAPAGDVRVTGLVRARSTADVAATLRLCHGAGVPVVTQGGRTGLVGGAAPTAGCVILSLELMRGIEPVDAASSTLVVEAGASLQSVQEAAERAGFLYPLDIGARGSCTIGGNIATNAGGNRVLRYGMTRDLVLGLEAVLADGTVVSSLHPMLKNNTGYDLKQLFIGSEGTLGVVTRAILRLFPRPRSSQTALCAVEGYEGAVALLDAARKGLGAGLSAFEVMWPLFYQLGTRGLGRTPPIAEGHGAYVLVEAMGADEERDTAQFQRFMEAAFEQGIVADAVIAQTGREAQALWAIRDSSGEFTQTFWPNVSFDVSIPIGRVGAFVEECSALLRARWADARSVWFGHLADSNLHIAVRVEGAVTQPEHEIDAIVYACVARYQGSISAEHGIGLRKRDYLCASRSDIEIALMRRLKAALDPTGILNPGKLLTPEPHASTTA